MLNRHCQSWLTRKIIYNATKLYSAEGGINFLYQAYSPKDKEKHLPDLIFEDSTEIRPDIAKFYSNFNIPLHKSKSLFHTELEKTLTYILDDKKFLPKTNNYQIVVVGGFGGRLDKTIQNISTLIKYSQIFNEKGKNAQLYLINNSSLITCLLPGKTKYTRTLQLEHFKGVGIIPFYEGTILRSLGLRWELDKELDGQMKIGNFLSTNNEFSQEEVYIETNKPVLLITKIKKSY